MTRYLALVTLLFVSAGVRAEEGEAEPVGVKASMRGTVGTGGYLGRGAGLQYGTDWQIKGTYADYRFDGSTGTTRTMGLRGSYQGENLAVGLTGSITPRHDSYANRAFGVDAGWTFILDDSDEPSGLEDFEVGGWWSQTRHSQIIPRTPALPVERNVIINQHDLGLTASLTGWDTTLSVDAFRAIYDQDFANIPAAARRRPRLAETASLVNGFPKGGASVRLDYARWRACSPYVSFSTTRYEIQPQPATATGAAGAAFRYGGFGAELGYELVRQKGVDDTKYFNFALSFRF